MKNLKRVLSLALATVMLLGIMVIGANAAFVDQDSITYDDAVDYLVGLGVLDPNGMGNGNFVPNGTMTRAQAAKMVAYVKAGGNTTTISYYDGETKFSDVTANHAWATGSINYCVATGIVTGRSETTFDPDTTLTGAELAKMMLVALGYPVTSNKATETLVGPNWQRNTLTKATAIGLFKDLKAGFSANRAVTREEAAQIMANALDANVVEISGWNSEGDPSYTVNTRKTLLTACFDVAEVTGVVTANAATGAKGTVLGASLTAPAATGVTNTSLLAVETGLDMIGHSVTVLVKVDKNGAAVVNTKGQVLTYGLVDNATLVKSFVSTAKGIEADLKAQGFGKKTSDYAGSTIVNDNYVLDTTNDSWDNGAATIAISNNVNKTVDYIIQVKSYLNKVTNIVTTGTGADAVTRYTFDATAGTGATAKTNAELSVYDGIAKDDFVVVTPLAANFFNLAKVTTAEATVTGFTNNALGRTGVVAGTTYAESAVDTTTAVTGVTTFASVTTGAKVLLLDGEGNLLGTTAGKAVVNYAYIARTEAAPATDANGMTTTAGQKIMVFFADGNKGAYMVDSSSTASLTNATTGNNGTVGLYNVVINGAGKAVVTAIADTTGDVSAVIKGVSKTTATTTTYTDANTVAFFVNSSYGNAAFSVTVQTGTANISSASVAGSYYKAVNGTNYATVLLVNSAPADQVIDVVYYNGVYSVSTDAKAVTTTTYTVYKNGAATTVDYVGVTPETAPGFYKTSASNLTGATDGDGNDKVFASLAFNKLVNGTLTAGTTNDFQVTDATVVVNLVPGSTLTLADLGNSNLVRSSTIAVAYTVAPGTSIRTATAIYITGITMA